MHNDQIHIDVGSARRMICQQFPQFRRDRIEQLDGVGTDNAIFRIGSSAAARFPLRATDPLDRADALRREAAAMAEFAEHAPVAAPRPIGFGEPDPAYPMPWSVQTWVEGDDATPEGLAGSTSFALDIAGLISALRAADTCGRCFEGQGRGGRLPDHDAWMAVCFENSEGLLDVPRLRRTWERLCALPPCGPDVMSHRDLIPANLLVRGDRLVGVLDSGGFGPADPALDLVAAWHLFGREAREEMRARLGSDDVEWRRGGGVGVPAGDGLGLVLSDHKSGHERPWPQHAVPYPGCPGDLRSRHELRHQDRDPGSGCRNLRPQSTEDDVRRQEHRRG